MTGQFDYCDFVTDIGTKIIYIQDAAGEIWARNSERISEADLFDIFSAGYAADLYIFFQE